MMNHLSLIYPLNCLLQNHLTNFDQKWHKAFLGEKNSTVQMKSRTILLMEIITQIYPRLGQFLYKRSMGHIAPLRNQFKIINTFVQYMYYDYSWTTFWTNLNPLYPRIHCAKFGWNCPSGSGEEDENKKSLQMDDR